MLAGIKKSGIKVINKVQASFTHLAGTIPVVRQRKSNSMLMILLGIGSGISWAIK